uniref:Phycobiliprotein ApcE n=1 Tax=Cyanidium caldarium TaxID=2771 RepID=APCE_CYACA|nr:phycobillisome linker protein [Cyanidium caldarium]Q9TLS6.1 RecName: Full=Phycobiliprotein ApcE; AltName: Full=Anchor polypeptide; AltName: Full=PBS-anchor protein; AltName: Full=Phycobilisome linker polypeptide [Cyanidium caldarium]AAF12901.1 unknown [Cyanidium caldarium]WDB00128.1 phycobillisome linker protein [Cyanidium caldarium]
MGLRTSSGSPLVKPKLYKTSASNVISLAEKQDRFLNLGELTDLNTYFSSGNRRLDIAKVISLNANLIISRAADRIFVGGSPLSFLERPQAAVTLTSDQASSTSIQSTKGLGNGNIFQNFFKSTSEAPTGFKPINVVRYGSSNMKKSIRDLDWFLRYVTYAIVAGDTSILIVNTKGLRELIDKACSSSAAIVALKEMKNVSLSLFNYDIESQNIVRLYFNTLVSEFESPASSSKVRKRNSLDLQGLAIPDIYLVAADKSLRYVMKPNLSNTEKAQVIKACYRQVFERDIAKAYGLSLLELESKLKNLQISVKEFIRALGKSTLYRKNFYEGFTNSRVVELAFRHFMGRGLSSLQEFRKYFAILSSNGLDALIDSIINNSEYAEYFGEETVPYIRGYGQEAQECRNWGSQFALFKYSAPFRTIPQFITLFADYTQLPPSQHCYGKLNDPLNIQFGAIFKNSYVNEQSRPVLFPRGSRRILVYKGAGIFNQLGSPNALEKPPSNVSIAKWSKETDLNFILNAAYLRVFGRYVYEEEKIALRPLENEFKRRSISVRDFVGQLAKSDVFRSLYWSRLYICKSIEYIHIRLLGRPTYGRTEINNYFDIVYKSGFYAFVDSLVNSREYIKCFGNDTVPYDRYSTPEAVSSSIFRLSFINSVSYKSLKPKIEKFIQLGVARDAKSLSSLNSKVFQGVSQARSQKRVFKVSDYSNVMNLRIVFYAALRQVFERNIEPYIKGGEFKDIESLFLSGKISVRELIKEIGSSSLYRKEFYIPFPNTQVIEFCTKHFLGRAPKNQSEIRYYNQVLAVQGLREMINYMINSKEYLSVFGDDIVPYRRFPTLPAANFPNTQRLYSRQTKQNRNIVVPSFSGLLNTV